MKDSQKTKTLTKSKKLTSVKIVPKFIRLPLSYVLPLLLAIFFVFVLFLNLFLSYKVSLRRQRIYRPIYTVNAYPFFSTLPTLGISAKAAIILDDQTQTVLYARNENLRFSMASTTKIMTALVALDHFKPSDVIQIYNPYIEGAKVGFYEGESMTFEQVLYGLMLPSGNDAAYALADNYPGGREEFVRQMNAKTDELHLLNTHYGDPAGLTDEEDYTTVIDLAHLASVAAKNPTLAKIVSTKDKIISTTQGRLIEIHNLNSLLGSDGVNGFKTGFTEEAGGVLVTTKEEKGHTFVIVVMKSENRFADTRALIRLIDSKISYFTPSYTTSL